MRDILNSHEFLSSIIRSYKTHIECLLLDRSNNHCFVKNLREVVTLNKLWPGYKQGNRFPLVLPFRIGEKIKIRGGAMQHGSPLKASSGKKLLTLNVKVRKFISVVSFSWPCLTIILISTFLALITLMCWRTVKSNWTPLKPRDTVSFQHCVCFLIVHSNTVWNFVDMKQYLNTTVNKSLYFCLNMLIRMSCGRCSISLDHKV